MNVNEMKNSVEVFLTAAEIAEVLKTDPANIRWTAQHCPERLGFPVFYVRKRLKIPRIPFLRYLGIEA